MATITTVMSIKDKVTPSFKTMTGAVRDFTSHITNAGHMLDRTPSGISKAVTKQKQLNREFREGSREVKDLTNSIKGMAAAYLGLETFGQAIKAFVGVSDTLTQIEARLAGIVGEGQALAEANEQIFISAQRARTSYADMADFITRIGYNAKDAFKDMEEMTTFAEVVNKEFALAGIGSREASMSMVQLSQALASGVLRGEELSSVFEQAPGIIKSIAKYMDVPIGQIREMASEGMLTSEIVKNAVLASAGEVEQRFNKMPFTWEQVWTQFVNQVTWGLRPLAQTFREVINTDGFRESMFDLAQAISTAATALGVLVKGFFELPFAEEMLKGIAIVAGVTATAALIRMGHAGVVACINTSKAAFMLTTSFFAAHPAILLLTTALLTTIVVLKLFGQTGTEILASLAGGFAGAASFIGAAMYNTFEGIKVAAVNAFEFIKTMVLGVFANEVAVTFAHMISGMAKQLEKAGVNTHGLDTFGDAMEGWRNYQPKYISGNYKDLTDSFQSGMGKGQAFVTDLIDRAGNNDIQSMYDKINQGMNIPQNVPGYVPTVSPMEGSLDDIKDTSKETADNTKKLADNLKDIGFDIAMLKASFMDTAMRKIEQNVKLDINMPMTSTSDVDLDGFVNEFVGKVQTELENTSPMMGQTGVRVYG